MLIAGIVFFLNPISEKCGWNEPLKYLDAHLNDLLDRDDITSMPQTNRLFWGQTLVAFLHHLQKRTFIITFCPERSCCWYCEGWFLYVSLLTSLKSLCSMKIVLVNGTTWLPLASLAGKSGTRTTDCRRAIVGIRIYKIFRVPQLQCNVCGFTSCTNLCVLRQVSYGDFEWFQYSHGSGCWVVKEIPHTRLQKVGLCRCLGNCDSDLPEDAIYCYKTAPYLCMW